MNNSEPESRACTQQGPMRFVFLKSTLKLVLFLFYCISMKISTREIIDYREQDCRTCTHLHFGNQTSNWFAFCFTVLRGKYQPEKI